MSTKEASAGDHHMLNFWAAGTGGCTLYKYICCHKGCHRPIPLICVSYPRRRPKENVEAWAMGEIMREKMTVASGALVGMMFLVILQLLQLSAAEQCGTQAGGALCPNNLCCSQYGWCGSTSDYCGNGCQSQCGGGGGGGEGGGGSTGKASFYTAPYVPSACYGYDPNQFPNNQYFAAAGDGNPNIWNNGANCGRNYRITCQGNGCRGGPITIKVVDRCPNGCSGGRAFDLSEAAFSALADPSVGVISISYSLASSHEGDEEHQVPLSFD